MDLLAKVLREHPELAIFLTLAIGFYVGRLRIGSFRLGAVVGTLLAGVMIGQFGVQVPAVVKAVFFDLFLFTTGYKVGPQFFRGLRKDALPQLAVTVVLCVSCLLGVYAVAKLLGYDVGTAAGLLAGAFTESTVIGTASDAIQRLPIPDDEKTLLTNNIPVAYAVTYLIGTGFVVWFLPTIGPRLMGIDLRDEGRKASADAAGEETNVTGLRSGLTRFTARAYRITGEQIAGHSVAELEARPKDFRVFIARIRRDGGILEPQPATVLAAGDVVAVVARTEVLTARGTEIGQEMHDADLLDFPVDLVDVVVTSRAQAGRTLRELAEQDFARGVFLRRLTRLGQSMPFDPETRVDRGDVLTLVGHEPAVARAAQALGYPDRPTVTTDMVFVGLGIFLGGLLGLLSVTVGGLPLTLTVSGGALCMGLVFGWLRSVHRTFGRIPEAAVWVFDTVGLTMFIAVVGIGAGPQFFAGIRSTGLSLVLVAVLLAVLPHTVAILFGRYVLRMNPLVLLGACSGAGTMTAALRAIQEEAQSKLPALGYTIPYALGNILLTAWGPVIVALMA
jgi:putative transport protein